MHRELLDALSVITEEEQRILAEKIGTYLVKLQKTTLLWNTTIL